MLSFHPLEVTSVERTAEDAVCVTLAIPPHCGELPISMRANT